MPIEWEDGDDDEPVGGKPDLDDEDDDDYEYEVWNEMTGRWELDETEDEDDGEEPE